MQQTNFYFPPNWKDKDTRHQYFDCLGKRYSVHCDWAEKKFTAVYSELDGTMEDLLGVYGSNSQADAALIERAKGELVAYYAPLYKASNEVGYKVLQVLRLMREEGPLLRNSGICANADVLTRIVGDACRFVGWMHAFGRVDEWPHYSGSMTFPVPPRTNLQGPLVGEVSEGMYQQVDDKWDTTTEYGLLRWDLLDYLIKQAERHGPNSYVADCTCNLCTAGIGDS